MKARKVKWTSEEEQALVAAVAKYGTGKWKSILEDPEFATPLVNRSNVDLKDKWRNISGVQGSKERPTRSNMDRAKGNASVSDTLILQDASSDASADDDPQSSPHDSPDVARFDEMIFEALLTIKSKKGSDIGAIANFVEQRSELSSKQNSQKMLGTRLGILVSQGKLKKVKNNYRLCKRDSLKPKVEETPKKSQDSPTEDPALIKEAEAAAKCISQAEEKAGIAALTVYTLERTKKLLEESEAMLQIATETYELSLPGKTVILS